MSEMAGTAVIRVSSPSRYEDSQVVPVRDKAFVSEPFLVVGGFPKVPRFWLNGRSVATADGSYVTRRDEPVDLEMEAHSRFIAHTFEELSGVWRPWITHGVDYLWLSPSGLQPQLDRHTYRIGKELIDRAALRFVPGDYLYSSFNSGIDDAIAFSMTAVISPLVPAGYTVMSTKDDQSEMSVSVEDGFVLRYGSLSATVPLGNRIRLGTAPVYMVMTNDGATATMWVGTSAASMRSVSINMPTAQVQRMSFFLGKTHSGKATSSMLVMDLLLHDKALTGAEVYRTVAELATSYGQVT